MSAAELVTVTIDGRELQVPKGTGIVETALSVGIEIPVFCYEPRLGPPLGACRMCLCEVEGMPKLQAACTLAAQDGMTLRTAQTSEKASFGQHAVLEFILLNHPLDCPDCDKGGECPLQDLTFRYGPGSSRMVVEKRTMDKPIPVSPLIALDRERCILCYRCTRFSESVAEDGQLVAVDRGDHTHIATFEDEPYRAHFSGNVVELCPVGALTSTVYRFRARPWEIQNVPTVCGLCPVGCNAWATTREGKVVRMLSRNHPEIDEGWLCDKGRFAHDHLHSDDRIREPIERVKLRGLVPVTLERAVDVAEEALRTAHGSVVVAFSGGETVEQADALSRLVRQGLGSNAAIVPDDLDPALDAYRAPALGDPVGGGLPRRRRRPRRRAGARRRPLAARRPPRWRRGDHRASGRIDRRPAGRRRIRVRRAGRSSLPRTPSSGTLPTGSARRLGSRSSGPKTIRRAAATSPRSRRLSGSARDPVPTTCRALRTAAASPPRGGPPVTDAARSRPAEGESPRSSSRATRRSTTPASSGSPAERASSSRRACT